MALELGIPSTHIGSDPEGVTIESCKMLPFMSYKFLYLKDKKPIKYMLAPEYMPGNCMATE